MTMITPDTTAAVPATIASTESAGLIPRRPTGKFRAAGLLIVLGFGIVWAMVPFAAGILGAAVFYVITVGAFRWLTRKRVPKGVAAALMLVLIPLLILIPGTLLVSVLVDELPKAIGGLDAGPVLHKLQLLRLGPVHVGEQLAKASGNIGAWASEQALGALGGAAHGTLNLMIALLGLYYLLMAADDVWPRVKRFMPFSDADSEDLRGKFYDVTLATVLGVILVAVLQGVLIGVAFLVVDLPNPLVWGTIAAFASVLPLVGAALVWVPGAIALFSLGHAGAAIGLSVFSIVVVSNVDALLRPLVARRFGNLHPLTTLLGAFAGLEYAGLIGVLLGPLAITWFFELLTMYDREYGLADQVRRLSPK